MRRRRYILGALLVVCGAAPMGAQAQTGTIRGKVTIEGSGQPVPGASVWFGPRIVQTNSEGQYVLTLVPAGSGMLRVRLIGYTPVARSVTVVGGQTIDLDIPLTASAVNLAEIVVTGYGEQRAGNITGAVTQVSAADFNTGRIVSPAELIRSKVPGVQVVDNNEPGGGFSIRIRGATSVNASSEPLVVIDGVPIIAGGGLSAGRNPLNFLNPNDIESVTVLRDASAAAIYGANAANGVLLITTKNGQRGTQFEYSGNMSASSVTRLPNMLNAEQFRAAVEEFAPTKVNQLGTANTNWFDQVDRTGFGQEHNFAVSGADDRTNWRLSAGLLDQDGVIQGTTTQRVSLGANFQQRLASDRLDIRASIRGSRAKDLFTPGGVLSNAAQFGPTQPVFDDTRPTGYYDWPGSDGTFRDIQSADNPVALLKLATDRGVTYRSIGSVQAGYRLPFLEGLKVNGNLAYDITRTDRQTFFPSVLHGQQKNGNGGSDFRSNFSQSNTTADAYLNYSAPLNVVPGAIDVTGGYSTSWSHAEYPSYSANGLSTDLLGGDGVTTARSTVNSQDVQQSRLISLFGRVNYNLNDKYLIAASIRHDGSSRFGANHQWGNFPSVSVGWRVSEEPFLKGKLFSDLKLRASWAKTGNQAIGNYLFISSYLLGNDLARPQFGDDFVGTLRPSAVDPNIKWEETNAFDLGLDFTIFNQRLTGTFDWYTKNTDDLLFRVPVAAGTALGNRVTTNIGSMKNRGVELGLSARLLQGARRGLTWTADFTASHNTNELTSINPNAGAAQQILQGGIAGGVGSLIQVLQPGVAINSFYVYQHKRGADGKPIYSTSDIDMYVDQPTVRDEVGCPAAPDCVGLFRPDGKINQDDRRPFHDPAPKWMLGHSSYLAYKSFDFSFTLRSYLGNYVYNNVASNLGTYSEVTRGSPYNLHASVLETGFETPQYLSDVYVESASFLRMDNLTLAYSLNYRNQPVRLFATLQNAFTITGYSGVDPTASIAAIENVTSGLNGIDNNIYPRARTFTAGLSFRF